MWEMGLSVFLKLLGVYLDWSGAKEDQKKAYLTFLQAMEPHSKSCVRLRKSYLSQRDVNLMKIKKMKEKKNGNS